MSIIRDTRVCQYNQARFTIAAKFDLRTRTIDDLLLCTTSYARVC